MDLEWFHSGRDEQSAVFVHKSLCGRTFPFLFGYIPRRGDDGFSSCKSMLSFFKNLPNVPHPRQGGATFSILTPDFI